MKVYLITKLKEITIKLKINNEEYMKKYTELVGSNMKFEKTFNPSLNASINTSFSTSAKSGNFGGGILEHHDTNTDLLRKRDEEINNLVSSIEELSNIFKDLQSLVFEQGNFCQ